MPDRQNHQDSLHLAMTRCNEAAVYFAMAWAKDREPGDRCWMREQAIINLIKAADAQGYKLVKAEAPDSSTVTILPLDPEEEQAA